MAKPMKLGRNIWERTVRFQEKKASKVRDEKKRVASRE